MAPEVALGQPYNETADVYSLTILLWQMLMLEPPFQNFTMSLLKKNVYQGGLRPKCSSKWSSELTRLMLSGWHKDIPQRPLMNGMMEAIRNELTRVTGLYYGGTEVDRSNRSAHGRSRDPRPKLVPVAPATNGGSGRFEL